MEEQSINWKRVGLITALGIVLIGLVVAIVTFFSQMSPSPSRSAESFVEAAVAFDGERVSVLTCSNLPTETQAGIQSLLFAEDIVSSTNVTVDLGFVLGAVFGIPDVIDIDLGFGQIFDNVQFDTSYLEYKTVTEDEGNAQVEVTGTLYIKAMRIKKSVDLDETWEMEFEQDEWKWCGRTN